MGWTCIKRYSAAQGALGKGDDRLRTHVEAALHIPLPQRELAPELNAFPAPSVDVAFAFDPAASFVAHLLPMSLVRPFVERLLRRKSDYKNEKHLSRLAAAWSNRVGLEIAALISQAEQQMLADLTAMESSMNPVRPDTPRLREVVAALEARRE